MVASETGRTEGTVETLPALAFGASGPDYTAEAIAAARERALLRGVRHIIVATSRGETARKVLEAFPEPEYNLVACFPPAVRPNLTKLFGAMADVTPGHLRVQQELNRAGSDEIQYGCPPDLRDHPRLKVVSDGFDHLGHTVFAQVPASLAKAQFFKEQAGVAQGEAFVISTLWRFSMGVKVGVQAALYAVRAGHVPPGAEELTLAGHLLGADTVLVVKTSLPEDFFSMTRGFEIREIAAKPRSSVLW